MQNTTIPAPSAALRTLLRFDLITQYRNRRSVRLILLVPVIILFAWKPAVAKIGGAFVLSSCITVGLTAIGLMGYANALARDRDRGIFQRLRVTPTPNWCIMVSRITVQLALILLLTVLVFIFGYSFDHISLQPAGYATAAIAAIVGGSLYLGLGQMLAGLSKSAETVNATTRLVYFVFIMVGMFGETGLLGSQLKEAVKWTPYGSVNMILSASMHPAEWTMTATWGLLVTIGYALLFAILGIKLFKWNTK